MSAFYKNIKAVNSGLYEMGKTYHHGIPLNTMFDLLNENGFAPVMEDGEPWSGLLCGAEGKAIIDLLYGGILSRKTFVLNWYKMPSGRYEITAYVS